MQFISFNFIKKKKKFLSNVNEDGLSETINSESSFFILSVVGFPKKKKSSTDK